MRTFAILTEPYGTFAVSDQVLPSPANPAGASAHVFAQCDRNDPEALRLRALVDQANAARELWDALEFCLMSGDLIHGRAELARTTVNKYRGIK